MEEKRCPLCGKDIQDDKTFCDDCRQIAQDELPEAFREKKEESEDLLGSPQDADLEYVIDQAFPAKKKTKKVRNTILLIVFGLMLLAIGWYSAKQVVETKAFDQTEAIMWENTLEENTLLAYSKYLVKYPEGTFATLAEEKIEEFHQAEKEEWEQIRTINNIADLIGYSKANLGTTYQDEISQKIDSLAWLKATTENTKTAYLFYIENSNLGVFPGKYKEQAQALYGEGEKESTEEKPIVDEKPVQQPVAVTGKDLKDVEKRIYDLADHISSYRFEKAKKLMIPTLDSYFGLRKKTTTSIFSEFKNDMYKKGIKAQGFYIFPKSLTVNVDNKGVYTVEVRVQKKITYISSKKKLGNEYLDLRIKLNKDKLVQSVEKYK